LSQEKKFLIFGFDSSKAGKHKLMVIFIKLRFSLIKVKSNFLFFSLIFKAFYGVIFKSEEEAAFSNYRLWESLGFAIAYAYSNYICTGVKLYLLLIYLSFGVSGYGLIEFGLRTGEKKKVQIVPF
jgi:hypothetical protein